MVSISSPLVAKKAESIPYVTADEAYSLLKVQFERLLTLLETLGPDDWSKPTACTLWNVREMVAHQAGGYSSGTSYREMIRQYSKLPKPGQLPEDAINEFQVRQRENKTPAELIAELRSVGPTAIQKWAYQFRFLKAISIPHPVAGWFSLRHLMWIIHSRDTWMHRLDICRATGRPFEQTIEQDGRIAELVMLDVEKALRRRLREKTIQFELTGIAGGIWKAGSGEPAATIRMDVLDFNIFVSGRYRYEEALSRAAISGNVELANEALENLIILF